MMRQRHLVLDHVQQKWLHFLVIKTNKLAALLSGHIKCRK